MRKTASLCWNFLSFLWWTILNSSVQKMCFAYEIRVPDNYTALGGNLEIQIIDLVRIPSENVRLELLEVEYIRSESGKLKKRETSGSENAEETRRGPSIKLADTRNNTDFPRLATNSSASLNESSVRDEAFPLKALSRVLTQGETAIPQIKVERKWTVLGSAVVPVVNDSGGVKVQFPCGVITRGGRFGVRLVGHNQQINNLTNKQRNYRFHKLERDSHIDEVGTNLSIVGLDVRWPRSVLSMFPHHVETYPDESVTALLQFLPTKCSPAKGAPIPEMWLDLLFCGHSLVGCAEGNSSHHQVVYSEQIRGYPKRRAVVLRCELFGTAGYFTMSLRSSVQANAFVETENKDAYLKAVWNERYIFNVHARSIFPCDVHGGGIPVLFQYPKCILKGDRVRLFSRLRADVSSLVPPTSLHYVTEQRVVKGKHSLQFDCDFFTEKYVEYCFVYVSQAITGAVSDVRMDCVPTLPIYDSDSGNWGTWNAWSPCTSTCGAGTRNRFRYCDSPPPKYGAKFCEGPSVQTERCGNTEWDCEFYQNYLFVDPDNKGTEFPANRPEIVAEVGPGCRCGCVVHLGAAKPRRLLATSSQSCPGRIFWQIEADKEHIIKFSVEHFRFPCGSQWLKVRDGDSRSSALIGELSRSHATSVPVTSSGPKLLIEFFSDELLAGGQECWGGFLAHAQQSQNPFSNTTAISSGFSISKILRNMEIAPTASTSLLLIHGFVALFVCIVILVSGCLGIQYVFRYRKYQLAAAMEDTESATGDSQTSLVAVRSRAASNSTLLSEVISLQRFKPTKKYKHSRLREDTDMDEGHLSESSESQQGDGKTPSSSMKTLKPESNTDSATSTPVNSKKSASSNCLKSEHASDNNNKGSDTLLKESCHQNGHSNSSSENGENTDVRKNVRKVLHRRRESLSTSSVKSGQSTTTNECNSPPSSATSTGPRNLKAKKEKKNLERLLAGSEFSLTADGDLELDYYDYNVQNASAVPESYIGMDPAYLVWIPPFSPVDWEEKSKESEGKSGGDDDDDDDEKVELKVYKERETDGLDMISKCRKNDKPNEESILESNNRGKNTRVACEHELRKTNERGLCECQNLLQGEKETRVEKSPSENSDYYRVMVDIKFADDEDDDDEEEEDCNVDKSKMESCSPGKSGKKATATATAAATAVL